MKQKIKEKRINMEKEKVGGNKKEKIEKKRKNETNNNWWEFTP